MKLNVKTSIDLSEEEVAQLAMILGCKPDAVAKELSGHAGAALREYVSMYLGQHIFTRGSDIRQYRLFLLIASTFRNRIPTESDVSALFQTTTSESRALIKSVMSKYQYALTAVYRDTMKWIINGATQESNESDYELTVESHNIIQNLNATLARLDGTLQMIKKKPGTACTYTMPPASRDRLKEHFQA